LLKDAGAQAIMLGGADLALVFDERDAAFPIIDSAAIHADAIVRFATS
jgi:aspartate racemase